MMACSRILLITLLLVQTLSVLGQAGNATMSSNTTNATLTAPPMPSMNETMVTDAPMMTNATMSPVNGTTSSETMIPPSNSTMSPAGADASNVTDDMMVVTVSPSNPSEDPMGMNHSNIFQQEDDGTVEDDSGETESPLPFNNSEANDACSQLAPGDVFVYVVATDDPDGVGFLSLEEIPAGTELYMTDNPWTGTEFEGDEGTVQLMVNESIPAGTQFGYGFDYGANQNWTNYEGLFNLGVNGDSMFLYCIGINGTINPLVGFSNAGSWSEPGLLLSEYGSEQSALPDQLKEVGSVVLPHLDNYEYKGPQKLEKPELQKAMTDAENWEGTDEGLGDQTAGCGMVEAHLERVLVAALALIASSLID